ncbi:thermonuclease family protein [Haloquadratum walsbyi]|jgi:micrococcal nuclease|uniref:thermonuclease family protein n=1 Tax=Haloquadratum walsbyi TaxID=293091 RepID=UPI0000DA0116|nr:endonuclease [Haloquadratum walsbyi]
MTTTTPSSISTPTQPIASVSTLVTPLPLSTEPDLPTTQTQTETIIDIIDGDTMDVRLSDGTVRLLGVDTPEISITQVSPEEWKGVPNITDGRDWLVEWSKDTT